ncbi:unnamed protein product [Paramecium octaurelia]|uniref:Uncharacterized protein n=1 Tax=Paramecium octaurelia TaxID=43137 RepID=A0A8S1W4Z4_PAROT|nr:unnamed protein product [Paramecium octaurelia]
MESVVLLLDLDLQVNCFCSRQYTYTLNLRYCNDEIFQVSRQAKKQSEVLLDLFIEILLQSQFRYSFSSVSRWARDIQENSDQGVVISPVDKTTDLEAERSVGYEEGKQKAFFQLFQIFY